MSERDRLHQIVDTLQLNEVRALLTLLESPAPVSGQEWAARLAEVSEEEEDVDEATAAQVLAAEAEPGEVIAHDELKRRLG